jgi:hypothetical protein
LWLRLVLVAYIATGVLLLLILLLGSRLAQALAEATRRFGLKADTAVTVDSARVMRLPDTKHSRSGKLAEMPISQVLAHDYTLDQMRHALAPYMGAQVIALNPRGNKPTGVNSDLAGGIETAKAPPINIRHCGRCRLRVHC